MTNDLLSRIDAARLEAALRSEPFEGDEADRVACYAAGQGFRRAVLGLAPDLEPPAIEVERFKADTTGAIGGTGVFPATWTYARRRSLAFQLARVMPMTSPKMVAASLTPTGAPVVRWQSVPANEGDAVLPSDPTWEATPVTVQAYTAVVWSVVSGELIDDMASPMTGDGIAQLGQVYMDALIDEIDRVYLEGDSAATEPIDGVIKKAGASAAAAASPSAALVALGAAGLATAVWVLDPATASTMMTVANSGAGATINALDSLSQLAEFPTIAGAILGRPAVVVHNDWLGTAKGVVGAFKRATVIGLRSGPSFDSTPEQTEAWTAGGYAVRAMVRIGIGVVQPTLIVKLT